MVVVCAERLAVEDIEALVRERFLCSGKTSLRRPLVVKRALHWATYLACKAAEALAVPLAFELAVGRGHSRLFDRFVTAPALKHAAAAQAK